MVSTEERMRILMMIQEGKISAAEGARLIEALDDLSAPTSPGPQPSRGFESGKKPRYLRVMVTDTDTGKTRVNVRLPVSLINSGVRMGALCPRNRRARYGRPECLAKFRRNWSDRRYLR